ncbi:photosynthetic NDH subunit of subcomplex B 4, chloroplastic-like isoform X2 [Hibiscus syriacus]|uniref:photosynthetic NDH subunit of subcomplex B 4, chloroplastic-like isoform X2 n=1 Tax=Hibiscus syriacus TaxID=106335 RepID=UPI001921BBB6|nr:photosynthetic NDH subunit of subcomplex B 4, chloroplastic-like isoform X2 [Hibiscus syriacus]
MPYPLSLSRKKSIKNPKLHENKTTAFKALAATNMSSTILKPLIHSSYLQPTKFGNYPSLTLLKRSSKSTRLFNNGFQQSNTRGALVKVHGLPDWPLMAVLVHQVQQLDAQREIITNKSVWHLSDDAIKNVYTFYIMFTCWGCLFFGSTKDPYYDSEVYRKDGGDGTGHWVYEKQEDIEESSRAELWREELIEEIEQKVGGLRELEEAGRK